MNDMQRLALLERDTETLKEAVQSIRQSNEKIAESLSSLVVLETKHQETRESLSRCFGEIKEVRGDVEDIKIVIPQLVESRKWVIAAMTFICFSVGAALLSLVIIK